eukprot:TRINITY_DN8424_c0_g1_i1.p2 TRINITY_DN8424_c0_g1~~TRINITY_DN8424_c0_g1_i1.p2  ORF type:complete len:76 (+),score=14.84 TRINITY_DN8424_c0_g1_i1:420-647(+)
MPNTLFPFNSLVKSSLNTSASKKQLEQVLYTAGSYDNSWGPEEGEAPLERTSFNFPHVLCVDTGRSSETAKAHRG